ncbi:hypothetical protein WG915_03940 [Corynebacterium sp. H128]|uniref:hypothetical protein n=1 Tax=Corynebacterium sp. H128 TaxID=3133427 RepID=UPI0030B0B830
MKTPASRIVKPSNFIEKLLAWQPLQIFTGIYGKIAIGGHLIVSDDAVVFEPHAVNLSNEVVRIPRENIAKIHKKQALAAAILVVELVDGTVEQFISWKRNEIIAAVGK